MPRKKKPAQVGQFSRSAPCANCPYRKDAPLRLWAVEEFIKLAEKEADTLGAVYGCHKGDGCVCVGWLMKQDEARLPSIALRIALSRAQVPVSYLDGLHSPAPLFPDVLSMCRANYPEFFGLNPSDNE